MTDVLAEAFHVQVAAPGSEGSGGAPALVDELLAFSEKVREYVTTREATVRDAALNLYAKITARLPEDDPRRRSLDDLKGLLG